MKPLKFRAYYCADVENNKTGTMHYGLENQHNEGYALGVFMQDQLVLGGICIMQFTTLFDKNNKEIWEKDVLKTEAGSLGSVVWYKGEWRILYRGLTKPSPVAKKMWSRLQVVGNDFAV